MAEGGIRRRLAAILAADMVGFSRRMANDEAGTVAVLKELRDSLFDPIVHQHQGRIFKATGDGVLVEFQSAVDAVACAVGIQRKMQQRNNGLSGDHHVAMRMGINLGDVIVEGDDILGDGVNVAARLEALAQPGGICVSAKVHEEMSGKMDVSFEDMGNQSLKNIDRAVRVYSVTDEPGTPRQRPSLALPDKPSIAVLPFNNMSSDSEQEYFADGVVEEITTALSRMRWLFVIARNSAFVYKHRAVDVKQVGRELGVRYLLEGSVRKAGERVRIAGQLIDTTTGSHIWADRFEGALTDIFDLQDRITESVAGAIQPTILSAEIERSSRKRPESFAAYDYVLRAFPLVWSLERSQSHIAQTLLERALDIEPGYPLALSLAAWCHAQRVVYNWTEELAEERTQALRLAQRAASISQDDPMVLAILGAAHTIVRDYRIAGEHLAKSLTLDPNYAWGWNRSGWLNVHRGQPDLAIEQFERAMRLSPLDPAGFVCLFGISDAHFLKGNYLDTIAWGEKGLRRHPDADWHLRVLVPAYFHSGHLQEGQIAFRKMMERYPALTIAKVADALPFSPDMMTRILDGLRKAGLPE